MILEKSITDSTTASGKLFSVGQITLATSLGAPIAGGLLIASNYRNLGKRTAAWHSITLGTASTIVIFVLAYWLPENFPNMALPVAYCFGMRQFAMHLQGEAISNHLKVGGEKSSWLIPIGVGLGCLAILFGLVVGSIFLLTE
jgi:hypothetical protein